ncbi:hypothetical protein DB30_04117 [Enhygromyxa salina]|uniref:Lipoprotein n=1 Tax=Enhygromyxa salina TaxID=215803 RepID=A0A0C2A073_9BACT|nr:hypothetical protein [Enhygromyxa salina]KIG16773.1 hypothetical protein DB30_04117 [Enhygromyxa salina]
MRIVLAPSFAVVLGLVSLSACKSEPGDAGASCTKKEECADGLSCLDGKCTKLEAPPEQVTGHCANLAGFAGAWTFDTTVVGSEDLSSRGINGHFQMTVSVDNCEGKIQLTKTGYDDVVFEKGKVQTSEAALSESKLIPGAIDATVSLKGKPTHTMTFIVREGQLFGYYQYIETEWKRAGIWGYLRGVQAGQDLAEVEDFSVQPCEVQCLTQCDAARRRSDATLDEPALAACMTACAAGEPITGCGPGAPLPDELRVKINGPAKSLDELCSKATAAVLAADGRGPTEGDVRCEKEPQIKNKPTKRALAKRRLGGSFKAAQLLQVGFFDAGYTGHLILALETEAGWFWTDSLADLSMSGVGGVSVTTRAMTLRARELLSLVGREVVAEITVEVTDSDLGVNEVSIDTTKRAVVCSTGAPPVCMAMTVDWSSERTLIVDGDDDRDHPDLHADRGELYLSLLPGDLVSISTPATARATDRELSGIYAWPK